MGRARRGSRASWPCRCPCGSRDVEELEKSIACICLSLIVMPMSLAACCTMLANSSSTAGRRPSTAMTMGLVGAGLAGDDLLGGRHVRAPRPAARRRPACRRLSPRVPGASAAYGLVGHRPAPLKTFSTIACRRSPSRAPCAVGGCPWGPFGFRNATSDSETLGPK